MDYKKKLGSSKCDKPRKIDTSKNRGRKSSENLLKYAKKHDILFAVESSNNRNQDSLKRVGTSLD